MSSPQDVSAITRHHEVSTFTNTSTSYHKRINRTIIQKLPGLWSTGVLDPFSFPFHTFPFLLSHFSLFSILRSSFLIARVAALGTTASKSRESFTVKTPLGRFLDVFVVIRGATREASKSYCFRASYQNLKNQRITMSPFWTTIIRRTLQAQGVLNEREQPELYAEPTDPLPKSLPRRPEIRIQADWVRLSHCFLVVPFGTLFSHRFGMHFCLYFSKFRRFMVLIWTQF